MEDFITDIGTEDTVPTAKRSCGLEKWMMEDDMLEDLPDEDMTVSL